MGGNAIEMEGVGKRYRLGEHRVRSTLRDAAGGSLRRLSHRGAHRSPRSHEEIWSLRDVTLDVAEGEAVGLIGPNGAGKSTLLKILTRITEPTVGVSRTRGRVGALLEVGTGFHPELTGRENVYLNGAILGMARRQTERRFDEIVSFAGVERFLDTPVKRYSSGMYLRLAFAVAAHLDADIMVVDEVLAVGDAEFQRRCLAKLVEVGRSGRTVMFVSHDLDAVARLCPTTIRLERGAVVARGLTTDVIDAYVAAELDRTEPAAFPDAPGAAAVLHAVSVLGPDGRSTTVCRRDEPFTIEVRFTVHGEAPGLDLRVLVETLRGLRVIDEAWSDATPDPRGIPGSYRAAFTVPPVLNAGDYRVGVRLESPTESFGEHDRVVTFRLRGNNLGRPDRVVHLPPGWTVESVPDT